MSPQLHVRLGDFFGTTSRNLNISGALSGAGSLSFINALNASATGQVLTLSGDNSQYQGTLVIDGGTRRTSAHPRACRRMSLSAAAARAGAIDIGYNAARQRSITRPNERRRIRCEQCSYGQALNLSTLYGGSGTWARTQMRNVYSFHAYTRRRCKQQSGLPVGRRRWNVDSQQSCSDDFNAQPTSVLIGDSRINGTVRCANFCRAPIPAARPSPTRCSSCRSNGRRHHDHQQSGRHGPLTLNTAAGLLDDGNRHAGEQHHAEWQHQPLLRLGPGTIIFDGTSLSTAATVSMTGNSTLNVSNTTVINDVISGGTLSLAKAGGQVGAGRQQRIQRRHQLSAERSASACQRLARANHDQRRAIDNSSPAPITVSNNLQSGAAIRICRFTKLEYGERRRHPQGNRAVNVIAEISPSRKHRRNFCLTKNGSGD